MADHVTGGKWGKNAGKTALEQACFAAALTPGPQSYSLPSLQKAVSGGRFSEGHSKSAIEWEIHRAKALPGNVRFVASAVF
jgi:hypothetical protein